LRKFCRKNKINRFAYLSLHVDKRAFFMPYIFGISGVFFARGIAAEPPNGKGGARSREGDGANSPTRACEAREAARPTNYASHNLIKN
jgi:hypothetical protein